MPQPAYLHCLELPTPFPVGPVNVYLAEGDPLTLIDTGPKAPVSRAALEAGLAAHGYRVEDLRQIIITHHHVDHLGLAGELVARSGARLVTHPYSAPWLTDYAAQRARQEPFYLTLWVEGGVPAEIVSAMRTAHDGISAWLDNVPPDGTLDEGDTVVLGGEPWQVFHTPGHAGGLICLWEPASRTLLANDHLIRDISSNPVLEPPPALIGPRPHRLVEYLEHMRRMAALDPAIALPGHGAPVTDVAGLVRQRQAFHQRRAQRLADTLSAGPLTLWELTQPIFPRLTRPMDFFLALSEILGHLDLLQAAGQVAPQAGSPQVRWARTPATLGYTVPHDLPTA
jgi:glyoxylase-like metal-dependent hydrolase (beta-lactamase superfamily II)